MHAYCVSVSRRQYQHSDSTDCTSSHAQIVSCCFLATAYESIKMLYFEKESTLNVCIKDFSH